MWRPHLSAKGSAIQVNQGLGQTPTHRALDCSGEVPSAHRDQKRFAPVARVRGVGRCKCGGLRSTGNRPVWANSFALAPCYKGRAWTPPDDLDHGCAG